MNEDDRRNALPEGVGDFDAHREDFDAELSGVLGASLKPIAPPTHVRDSLLAAIRETPQEGSVERPVSLEPDTPAARTGQADTTGGAASVHELRPSRRGPIFQWAMRAVAAVVLVGVGLGGYSYGRSSTMSDMSDAHSYAMLNQMQDVERASDTMPDGHVATLTWSTSMKMAAVTLPEEMNRGMGPESGKLLRVWVRKGGGVTSAGVYAPSKGMDFTFIPIMPENGIEVFVTEEPMDGPDQPTGKPLVVMRVSDEAGPSVGSHEGGAEDDSSNGLPQQSSNEEAGQA